MNRTRIVAKRLTRLERVSAEAQAEIRAADRQVEALERQVDELLDALTAVGNVEALIARSDELRAVLVSRIRARNAAYLRRQAALRALCRIEGRLERTERRVAR